MREVIAETERLILCRYEEKHLNDFYEYISNPNVVKFEPHKPLTLEQARQHLEWRAATDEMIAVELKDGGKMLGNVYMGKRDFNSRELGYVFNDKYQGQGYAAESCKRLIEKAFFGGVHRIYAECDPENTSSWRLLERLGFTREAHLKQNVYFWTDENGRPIWKDTYIYSMLSDK